ncbi:MAG TPA: hypothetical protein VNQ99_06265 [Xanthobacteraceae bacterium]|nr:hypothetical protein [Xanthobacteraceae bacterium]
MDAPLFDMELDEPETAPAPARPVLYEKQKASRKRVTLPGLGDLSQDDKYALHLLGLRRVITPYSLRHLLAYIDEPQKLMVANRTVIAMQRRLLNDGWIRMHMQPGRRTCTVLTERGHSLVSAVLAVVADLYKAQERERP